MKLPVLKKIILFTLVVAPLQMAAMSSLKDFAKKAAYYITPSAWNPRTVFNDNYHTVIPGQCFRSKTMSPAALAQHIEADKIKGILILREMGLNDYWYHAQKAVAQNLNVALYRVELNARVLPSRYQLKKVLYYLKNHKDDGQPILIHCVAGVDRTGMISALRLMMDGVPTEKALEQLALKYGHMEWRFPHCRETIKQLGQLIEMHGSLEVAIDNFPAQAFNPPSLSVRAATSFKNMITDAVKKNKKTSIALGLLTVAGAAAAYAHKKGQLIPALKAAKERIVGK